MNPLSKGESGQALILVLILLLIGGLMLTPLLNFVGTGLKSSQVYQQKTDELYAADAGAEYALWKIKNDDPPFPPYQITGINGLSVDIDIDEADTIAGEPVGGTGRHAEWLIVTTNVTYDAGTGNYTYTMSVSNNGSSTVWIAKLLIELPPGVDYVPDSTSSDLTNPQDAEPTTISGSSATGITPVWENGTPGTKILAGETKHHCFKLSGPPGIEEIEGHGFVEANRPDVGTVWIMDDVLYSIRSQAKDASGAVLAEIRARVWGSSQLLDISSWQIIP